MKKILRNSLSLLLAFVLTTASITAAASEALGEDLKAQDTEVNHSTTLSSNVFWSTAYSDLRTENLITYTPNAAVTPIVTYGAELTSCTTVSTMASSLEAQGYRVVAGMNGDFYNTTTGLPIGLVVSNGEVKTSDGGYYAIGFHQDGTAVLGKPALKVTADLGYTGSDSTGYVTEIVRELGGINKARVSTGGIYLYTYDFNSRHTTGTTEEGVDVLCTIENGSLAIGGTLTARIDSITQTSSATPIGPNQVVLSANAKSNAYYTAALLNAPLGGTVTLNVSASSEEWNGVQSAVGALYQLVQNGSVVSGLATGVNPRTAVGQKPDGTLVFYTIDGRQSGYSIGASLAQVGERLIELGCTTALCLDGGGSTTLTVTQPTDTAAKTVSKPSGGSERAVSNQVFLVASSASSNVLDHFYVAADNHYVLAGSKVNIAASAVDTNYIPMSAQSYTLSASAGTIAGNVLTTPSSGGDVTVTASGGGRSGSAVVHAISTPDSIAVKNGSTAITTLNMTPGSTHTLTASAVYHHLNLAADAGAFTWTLTGNIGTVDATGKITATEPGKGTLTVTAGGKTATVAVTVGTVALKTLEGFEGTLPASASYSYGTTLSANSAAAYVQYGRLSGKVDYVIGSDSASHLVFDTPYEISAPYTQLNFWVYGDNSGNALTLTTSDGTTTSTTNACTLDFTGWKQLSVTLPAGTAAITGFQIAATPTVTVAEDGSQIVTLPVSSGTVYLDQLVASYGAVVDTAAPVVTAAVTGDSTSGYTLSGTVSDTVDGHLSTAAIAVMVDGKSVAFNYDESTGKVSAAITAAAAAGHRVSVFARDASGNIGRASCDIDSYDVAHHFTDIKDYWGSTYVDFMYTAGITTGYSDGTFRPNQTITRQQFAAMLFRYLGLDATRYADVTLPFADADQIADYALPAVRALYSIGIIGGSSVNGQLCFNPNGSLTRAQAAAMIGRTQEKGYATAALSFTDAASVPAYAAYYIQTMSAQGVIGGYTDGSFKPNASITRGQMAKILYNLL
jgi:exopolysaccharide biosynthesis protein